jgi:hypothetical protein
MFPIPCHLPTPMASAEPRRRELRLRPLPLPTRVQAKAADGAPTGHWAWLPLAPDAYRVVVVVVESS